MQLNPASNNQVKVVIVDDHPMLVELITEIIGQLKGYQVVGHAGRCTEAVEICRKQQPHLVILDVGLPDSTGLDPLAQIKTVCPGAHVLIFSGFLSNTLIKSALAAGADGILSKASATAEIKTAIQSVSTGQAYLCRQTSEAVRQMVHSPQVPPVKKPVLTRREQTVLRHIAAGLSSKEIAAKLGVSFFTVNNFRTKLLKKTGLHRAVQLSLYAARMGLTGETVGSAHPHS